MHDIAEGVAKFGMLEVLKFYLSSDTFTLHSINKRIKLFSFFNKSNRPPSITKNQLDKGFLSYSASETINLVLFFNLIAGDFVPCDCKIWNYYLVLRRLVNLILSKWLTTMHSVYLETLIDEHHTLYKSLFQKTLKPKHHLLTHYPRILKITGPFAINCSMRFESKHRLIKLASQVTSSRINLSKSVMLRQLFAFASQIYQFQHGFIVNECNFGPNDERESCYRWVCYNGNKYNKGDIVKVDENQSDLLPVFGKVKFLEAIDSNSFVLHLELYNCAYYDIHLASYVLCSVVNGTALVSGEKVSPPLVYVCRENIIHVCDIDIQ